VGTGESATPVRTCQKRYMNTKGEEGPHCTTAARATLPEDPRGGAMTEISLWLRARWIEVLIVSLLLALSSPLMRQG
jgi:hypothetical protein